MSKKIVKVKEKTEIATLQYILDVMEKYSICELSYDDGKLKIQLKKFLPQQPILSIPQMVQNTAPVGIPTPVAASVPAATEEPKKIKEDSNTFIVKAPMVGTFYRAPSTDAPPFVNIGDAVEPGKTLCIIEAMKIMNEIKAEVKGKIREILVENGQAVEYNQPIIIIERS